ncbi:Fur family transcriptional regulator [Nocardia mangyaensis]|uniref:Fur family transcriptional regulator n=1 Tax=Nocardia mangyaensis TaxID=2213200 RepID=UPI0026757486|nr:transcriptional repressor [Nocardia mangyaensis]MDO3647857.1 transcriptional repressor [Nocardia mangyaensis]
MSKTNPASSPRPRKAYGGSRRDVLLAVLGADKRCLSAGEIYYEASHFGTRGIGYATVYRILGQLISEGRVVTLRGQAGARLFRIASDPDDRHSLWCTECGRAQPISAVGIVAEMERFAQERGFTDLVHHISVQGRCRDCAP